MPVWETSLSTRSTHSTGWWTVREQAVARLILRGHSTVSIAETLGISQATVKIHRRNLYAKLNISSQSELCSLFIDVLSSSSAAGETKGASR